MSVEFNGSNREAVWWVLGILVVILFIIFFGIVSLGIYLCII